MEHMIAAENVLCYLKGTLNYGLFYPIDDYGNLHTFTNVDWARDPESQKSTSDILYKFRKSPIA